MPLHGGARLRHRALADRVEDLLVLLLEDVELDTLGGRRRAAPHRAPRNDEAAEIFEETAELRVLTALANGMTASFELGVPAGAGSFTTGGMAAATASTSESPTGSRVIGQPDFTSSGASAGTDGLSTAAAPFANGLAVDATTGRAVRVRRREATASSSTTCRSPSALAQCGSTASACFVAVGSAGGASRAVPRPRPGPGRAPHGDGRSPGVPGGP